MAGHQLSLQRAPPAARGVLLRPHGWLPPVHLRHRECGGAPPMAVRWSAQPLSSQHRHHGCVMVRHKMLTPAFQDIHAPCEASTLGQRCRARGSLTRYGVLCTLLHWQTVGSAACLHQDIPQLVLSQASGAQSAEACIPPCRLSARAPWCTPSGSWGRRPGQAPMSSSPAHKWRRTRSCAYGLWARQSWRCNAVLDVPASNHELPLQPYILLLRQSLR